MDVCIWAIYEDKNHICGGESKQVSFGGNWSLDDAFKHAMEKYPDADHYQMGSTNGVGGVTGPERGAMPGD